MKSSRSIEYVKKVHLQVSKAEQSEKKKSSTIINENKYQHTYKTHNNCFRSGKRITTHHQNRFLLFCRIRVYLFSSYVSLHYFEPKQSVGMMVFVCKVFKTCKVSNRQFMVLLTAKQIRNYSRDARKYLIIYAS